MAYPSFSILHTKQSIMKFYKNPLFLLFIVLLLLLTACHAPKDLVFKEFNSLSVDNISFSGATLRVNLVYYNPNNFGLQLNRTDLDVYIDSTYLGHSAQDIQVAIPKRNNFTLPLQVNLDIKNLLKNGINSYFNRNIAVRVLGNVKLGKAGVYKSFPVDYTSVQNFSMFK